MDIDEFRPIGDFFEALQHRHLSGLASRHDRRELLPAVFRAETLVGGKFFPPAYDDDFADEGALLEDRNRPCDDRNAEERDHLLGRTPGGGAAAASGGDDDRGIEFGVDPRRTVGEGSEKLRELIHADTAFRQGAAGSGRPTAAAPAPTRKIELCSLYHIIWRIL